MSTVLGTLRLRPSAARTAGVCVLALTVELLVLQLILPAVSLSQSRVPTDVLVDGVLAGMAGSLTAAGIVLIHRSLRIINFAQGAIGVGGAVLFFNFIVLTPVPFIVALPLGLLVSALLGAVFDLVAGRRFANAPRLALTVFTVAAAAFLSTLGRSTIDQLPFFPDPAQRTVAQTGGGVDVKPLLPFRSLSFHLPGQALPSGFGQLLVLVLPVVLLGLVAAFLRFTRLGIAVRALAENRERAALLGISTGLLATVIWAVAGALSGAGAILTGILTIPGAGTQGATGTLLLPALAAAVLAGMRSIPVAVVASVAIAAAQHGLDFTSPTLAPVENALLLVVIVGALLSRRRQRGRSEAGATVTWAASEEVRPVPTELNRLGIVRALRFGLIGLLLVAVAVFPFVSTTGDVLIGQVVLLDAVVGLSLVVLTGWTGQVSLGQMGFAAIGAVVAAGLADHLSIPFWFAVPAAVAVTAGTAVLLGIPALRIPGLFLAVATFAFAAAVHDLLFDHSLFSWLLPRGGVGRPSLPFVDLEDERSWYFVCVAALALTLAVLNNVRRSRLGRLLIAVRDNEANAQAAGISVLRTRLTGFALSGAVAGFGGALLAFQEHGVSALPFAPEQSLTIFVNGVVGGVGNLAGPLLGTAVVTVVNQGLKGFPEIQQELAPTLAVVLLYTTPGGLVSVMAATRDVALRIVAQRNGIVVPSLFADVDPEALHLRLIPLGAPVQGSGAGALHRGYVIADSRRVDRRSVETRRGAAAFRLDDLAVVATSDAAAAEPVAGAHA